jgi:ribosomal protein S18 acetylase RimI-like enzyme
MNISFRTMPVESDVKRIGEIVESTGFFYEHETEIAVELISERLKYGISSDYYFVFAEEEGVVIAYSCYGPISISKTCFDLYWIVTHNDFRGMGIGKKLLEETCKEAALMGCSILIAETSGLEHYLPTRAFYEKNGFAKEARIKDFYDFGDDKLIYTKRI